MFFSLKELDILTPFISNSKEITIKNLTVALQFFSKEKQSTIIANLLFKITEINNIEYQYLYTLITDCDNNTN